MHKRQKFDAVLNPSLIIRYPTMPLTSPTALSELASVCSFFLESEDNALSKIKDIRFQKAMKLYNQSHKIILDSTKNATLVSDLRKLNLFSPDVENLLRNYKASLKAVRYMLHIRASDNLRKSVDNIDTKIKLLKMSRCIVKAFSYVKDTVPREVFTKLLKDEPLKIFEIMRDNRFTEIMDLRIMFSNCKNKGEVTYHLRRVVTSLVTDM